MSNPWEGFLSGTYVPDTEEDFSTWGEPPAVYFPFSTTFSEDEEKSDVVEEFDAVCESAGALAPEKSSPPPVLFCFPNQFIPPNSQTPSPPALTSRLSLQSPAPAGRPTRQPGVGASHPSPSPLQQPFRLPGPRPSLVQQPFVAAAAVQVQPPSSDDSVDM
ncbi:uncharacterized protein LOC131008729 [Salvia miltiorrhiza]|uniref:uncharacterized protein LOC131008729 n=1 Tax=Salvia miltiorrhiza TaxID=226208 RepID=UPI0025AB775B|nr:uncharacterized protein LOC131008729 [Salvia miltiorrhiza]